MKTKIQATRWQFQSAHSDELISTRIVPQQPYTQDDIHTQFESVLHMIDTLEEMLDQDLHLTRQQFQDRDFAYKPGRYKRKGWSGKHKVKFIGKLDVLRHNDLGKTPYTVKDIREMINKKLWSTIKGTKDLAHFTEAQLKRTNKAITWFGLLADWHYNRGEPSQAGDIIRNNKIEVEFV